MQKILEALSVTAEVCGAPMSEAAARIVVRELSAYDESAVLLALRRCTRECKRSLTLADIIERISDGRPNANEAWARMPKGEQDAGAVTAEMLSAWGIAGSMFGDDPVGARMAFLEAYRDACQRSRDTGRQHLWQLSAGWDRHATLRAARQAIDDGLLTLDDCRHQLSGDAIAELTGPAVSLAIGRSGPTIANEITKLAEQLSGGRP